MFERSVFAHRGLSSRAPENTFAAFNLAARQGFSWIETDVDVLGDGTVVVCHDSTLDRTTNATGSIYDLTVADLARIDAGSWFGPQFAGERLPTLTALVDWLNATGMNANIELKGNELGKVMSLRLVDGVIAELERLSPGREIIVSSFSHVLLSIFKQRAPKLPVACLFETCALYPDWRSVLELVGADYLHPEDAGLTRERIELVRRAGFGVNVWTVNDPVRAAELFAWGATGVFTDVAELAPRSTSLGVGITF